MIDAQNTAAQVVNGSNHPGMVGAEPAKYTPPPLVLPNSVEEAPAPRYAQPAQSIFCLVIGKCPDTMRGAHPEHSHVST